MVHLHNGIRTQVVHSKAGAANSQGLLPLPICRDMTQSLRMNGNKTGFPSSYPNKPIYNNSVGSAIPIHHVLKRFSSKTKSTAD